MRLEQTLTTDEFKVVKCILEEGGTDTCEIGGQHGAVRPVPEGQSERQDFLNRWCAAPIVSPSSTDPVFVFNRVQVGTSGRMQMSKPDGTWSEVFDVDAQTIGAWPQNFPQSTVRSVEGEAIWYCACPLEKLLLWERAGMCLSAGETRTLQDRLGSRHRVVLVEGALRVNGALFDKPEVISVKAGDFCEAVGRVRAMELWV